MDIKVPILTICFCIALQSLFGQCPDKDSLLFQIKSIKASFKIEHGAKLKKLIELQNKIEHCSNLPDSTVDSLTLSIASVAYVQGEFLASIQNYQKFINKVIAESGNNPSVLTKLPRIYYRLSESYASLDNVNERMRALDNCIKYANKVGGLNVYALFALYTKAKYLFDIGDYSSSMNYLENCSSHAKSMIATGTEFEKGYALRYLLSSDGLKRDVLLLKKDFASAEILFKDQVEECKKQKTLNYLGIIYEHLAEVEVGKNNLDKAIGYFNTAFQYEKQYGTTANCITILNNMGIMYSSQMKDSVRAFSLFRKAVEYGKIKGLLNSEDSLEALNALTNLANAYSYQGRPDSAFKYYASAFNHLQPGADENSLLRSSDSWLKQQNKVDYLLNLVVSKADAYRGLFKRTNDPRDIKEALRVYKAADALMSRVRKEHSDIHSKLFWRNFSRRLYENAIEACYANQDALTAFYFFEKSRAVILNDQLHEQRWLGENDILQMTQVKKRVVKLERECDTLEKNSTRFSIAQNELLSCKQQLQGLMESIRATNPLYYQAFIDTSSGNVQLQTIKQQILNDHEALIEIFNGEEAVYFLTITKEKQLITRVDKKSYELLSNDYLRMLSNAETINMHYNEFIRTANELYKLLFSGQTIRPGRIIISPDGKYFPFESLVMGISAGKPQYMIDHNSVSYTYSAGFLLNQFAIRGDRGTKNFLGVAPVKFHASPSLAMLAGSDNSLERLMSRFPKSDNLISTEASKKNFLEKYHNYKIIQLYTHADQNLSGTEPVIHFVDSSLTLSDLMYEQRPATSLIVLSACETGAGKHYEGEGIFSFNRGFAALGIPSSISNLWQVDNESTYKITELFYEYLAEGEPMDVALQKAKNAYRKTAIDDKQLPYYWAAAILSGKTDPILIEKEFKWKYILLIALAGLIVLLLTQKIKN